MRYGRLKLANVSGSEKANLLMPLQAQYWSGSSWVLNGDDTWVSGNGCTSVPASAAYVSTTLSGVAASGAVALSGGKGNLTLTKPSTGATGSADVAINLGSSGVDQSCLSTHGGTASSLSWLRSQNGNCAATYDRDPSARATFGIYSGESKKTVHIRELF